MPSLPIIVLVLQLAIHIVNTVGASAINESLWIVYNKLISSSSPTARKQQTLQKQLFRLAQDLKATSSQDEFAKWAKIRREHDKKQAEYDALAKTSQTFKTKFDLIITTLRYISTNGLRVFLQFYYVKSPMFWFPRGGTPWYIEWALAFPKAPMGSVSIMVWGMACATVIRMINDVAVAAYAFTVVGRVKSSAKEQRNGNVHIDVDKAERRQKMKI